MKTASEWRFILMQTAFRPPMTYPTNEIEWGDYIENWIKEAQRDALEEVIAILKQQQRRFLASEGAYHVLESIARDHIRALMPNETGNG